MSRPSPIQLLELPDISSRLSGPILRPLSDGLLSRCDELLDEKSEHFLDHHECQKPHWHSRQGIFVVPPALQALSAGYLISGESRYGEAARGALMAIVRKGLADAPSLAWGAKSGGWRRGEAHDKFLFALGVWQTMEFCGGLFSDEEKAELIVFLRDSQRLSLEATKGDSANVTNNRGVRGLMASALWALLLKSFEPVEELDRILTRAWIALEKHLYFAFDAQGAPYEGPAYAGNTLGSLALMAEVLHRQGKPNLLFHRTFERHPAHLAAEWIPGFSGVNNLNDSAHPSGSVSGSLFWMNRTGGEILPWLAQRLDLAPDRLASRGLMTNSALREYLNFLLWWDEKIPVRSPDDLGWPLSRCFPIRGVASHRTGWSSSDVLVSHFCGRQEVLCHRQGDQNHVAFYYAGDHLLVDAGYGSGHKDMSKAMDRWFGLTEAHNCVMIDGMNQRGVIESPGWCEGEMIDFHDAPDVSVSTGDASSATGVDHRVAQSVRQVALHRSGSSPLVTVWDRNEKDGQIFKTEVLWHTHVNHRIEGNSHGGVIHAKNCDCHVFVLNLRGENLEVIAEIGFGRPRLRVCMVAAVSELVTVFVPVPVGSPRPSIRWESEDPPARRLRVSVSGRKDVMVDICSP